MIINLDIDGVLFDFVGAFREFVAFQRNVPGQSLPQPTEYYFAHQWGITEDQFSEYFQAFERDGRYREAGFYLGKPSDIHRLKGEHTLNLVTARGTVRVKNRLQQASAKIATLLWLTDYSVPYDGMFFTHKKTHVRGDVLIDDCVSHLEEAAAIGMRAICFDQPYNQVWTGERVKSLAEIEL